MAGTSLTSGKKIALIAIFAVAAACLGIATFAWITQIQQHRTQGPQLGSDFELVDQRGDVITQAAIEDGPALLFFGFTNCPEICPTTVVEIDMWLEELGPAGQGVDAFFVTIDPERDRPEALNDYLSYFSDRVTGISGDPEQVLALADSWKVFYRKVPDPDGDPNYNMDHSASVYMLKPGAEFYGLISYGTPQDEAVEKLRGLLAAS